MSRQASAPTPQQPLASPTTGLLQRCGKTGCNCHPEQEWSTLRRAAARTAPTHVPPVVHEVLRDSGQPLTPSTRAFFEPRFGHDFSAVRLHADHKAADSARSVGARAYTVGTDIVLGDGAQSAAAAPGSKLLAHELAHVVQQQSGPAVQAKLTIGEVSSPAEREADRLAEHVARGDTVTVRERGSTNVVQRQLSCPELISPTDVQAVSGIGNPAHDAIEDYFRSQVGPRFWRRVIPGSSFAPYRTEDTDPRRRQSPTGTEQVEPQIVGGRAGRGEPDLGYRDGGTVELAEVKPAILHFGTYGGLVEGMFQLANYIEKGKSPENSGWRGHRRITSIVPMLPTRITWPGSLNTSRGQKVAVGWCLPGLVGYRPLSAEEAETIVCGVSDQKTIDKFLNVTLDSARGAVDRFINGSVDALLTKKIQTLSIQEGLTLLARYARGALRDFLNEQVGPGAGTLVELLRDDQLVGEAARWIQDKLGPEAEALLRRIVLQVKTKLLTEVRRYIKDRLRTYLQESLAAVCAAAAVGATISVAQLLKRLAQDVGKIFGEAVVEVAKDWAIATAKEFAKDLVIALLISIAVVVVIFFLPEILAAVAATGAGLVAAGGAVVTSGPRLLPMLNELVRSVFQAAPALQEAHP